MDERRRVAGRLGPATSYRPAHSVLWLTGIGKLLAQATS